MSTYNDLIKDFGREIFSKESEHAQKAMQDIERFQWPDPGVKIEVKVIKPMKKLLNNNGQEPKNKDGSPLKAYDLLVDVNRSGLAEDGTRESIRLYETDVKKIVGSLVVRNIQIDPDLNCLIGMKYELESVAPKTSGRNPYHKITWIGKDDNTNPSSMQSTFETPQAEAEAEPGDFKI